MFYYEAVLTSIFSTQQTNGIMT